MTEIITKSVSSPELLQAYGMEVIIRCAACPKKIVTNPDNPDSITRLWCRPFATYVPENGFCFVGSPSFES